MYTVLHYLDVLGKDHFQYWLDALRDRQAKVAIIRRVARLASGLAGDRQSVRGGVQELRIDVGPDLLACGGTKGTQEQDIIRALDMLRDWKDRHGKNSSLS